MTIPTTNNYRNDIYLISIWSTSADTVSHYVFPRPYICASMTPGKFAPNIRKATRASPHLITLGGVHDEAKVGGQCACNWFNRTLILPIRTYLDELARDFTIPLCKFEREWGLVDVEGREGTAPPHPTLNRIGQQPRRARDRSHNEPHAQSIYLFDFRLFDTPNLIPVRKST
ncbi:hypothetical protein Y032_0619g725 [Ancylostoma ceylanicum]|uniref:Uncharacterized protein n=1 Tax=Ancylostoma ceylanicum TaxID=53326 RepID=A0A016WMQ1_9BILA|nr:hypothetical protein Y032_0619g725 [Ancylostoma ceylanicum]